MRGESLTFLGTHEDQVADPVIEAGHANLPRWAKAAEHFFTMADRYERPGWIVV